MQPHLLAELYEICQVLYADHNKVNQCCGVTEDYISTQDFKQKLEREYLQSKKPYEKLVDEVLYILSEALEKSQIKYHSLTCRKTKIKTFDSFYEKVKRNQVREKQFEIITDIAAVRIICLYRSDLKRIGKIISANFGIVRSDTSRTRTETPFGYSSDHYIVKIPEECKGVRYDDIRNIPCEIQVRTILMDAWASVSHHLDYKQELDIPSETIIDFNALAGLFYIADTHFEFFKKGVEVARAGLVEKARKGKFDVNQAINLDSLIAYLRYKLPEREECGSSGYSMLISVLRKFGYNTLVQLDSKVDAALHMFDEYENEISAHDIKEMKLSSGIRLNDVGVIRHVLDLMDDAHWEIRRKHWSKGHVAIVEKYRQRLSHVHF